MKTPYTDTQGFVGTKTFNPATQETQVSATRKDPNSGEVSQMNFITDKSGKTSGTSTTTLPDDSAANKGGQKIVKEVFADGHMTNFSVIQVSAKGDSSTSKTTNFDPNTSVKTSEVTVRANGSTTTTNYSGCELGGTGCKLVSNVDTDPKTGKQTTTTYDKDGKVSGTQVSDIPKGQQQNAAMLKAGQTPNNLAGNNQHDLKANDKEGLAAPKPHGLTDHKANVTTNSDGTTTTVTRKPDGTSTSVTKDKDGNKTSSVTYDDKGNPKRSTTFDSGMKKDVTVFDAAGKKASFTSFYKNGNKAQTNTYDDKGHATSSTNFGQDGEKAQSVTYDDKGNPKRSTTFDSGMKKDVTVFDAGKKASFTSFNKDGNKAQTNTYDDKGHATSSTNFGQDGKKTSFDTYDDKGHVTSITHFGPDGRPKSVSTVDVNTNAITKTVQCDAPGKCPQTTAHNLAGNNQEGVHANKLQGFAGQQVQTGAKEQVKADTLNQIQGKPGSKGVKQDIKADLTQQPLGPTSNVTHNPDGSSKEATMHPDGSSVVKTTAKDGSYKIQNRDPKGHLTSMENYDPKTNKVTGTWYDQNGQVTGHSNYAPIHKLVIKKTGEQPKELATGKQDIKADVANQIGINPSGGVQANQKGIHPEQLGILKPNKNVAVVGPDKNKESLYKGEITPRSKFQSIPKSQSPSEFSQGNKHQPHNNLTTNYNAKSKSQNLNSSAGSQGAAKHNLHEKPRSN